MKYYGVDFIDDFLYEKSVNRGLSSETIRTYTSVFNVLFLNPYIDVENFESYTEMNFKRMLGDLLLKNKWTSHTYNRYRKNLKSYCDYLVKNNYLKENPMKNIPIRKVGKNLPKCLDKKQIRELMQQIEKKFNTTDFITLRNKTIMYFYIYTGCRLKELINLKFGDIDFLKGTIRINHGKGNKDRIIPLTHILSDFLIKYFLKKKKLRIVTDIVFPTRYGGLLQHRDIYAFVDKLKQGLSFNFTPHMLRHTFATELVRKNVNLYNISKVLGHSNVKTTQIYIGLDTEEIRENLNNIKLYG